MSILRVRQASNPPSLMRALGRIRGGASALMLIGACLLVPRAVYATTPVEATTAAPILKVQRAPGAETCPDATWLEHTVSSVVGAKLDGTGDSVEVVFSRDNDTYSAVISYSSSPGEQSRREIRDVSDDCVDLGHATATALTILFELKAETASKQPQTAAPARRETVATKPSSPAEPRAPERPSRMSLAASAGAVVAYGLIDGTSFGALFEATFATEWLGIHAGALWLPETRYEVPPGSIDTELQSLSLRACWRAWRGSLATLGGCTGFFAGTLQARASGFTTNTDIERPWLAVPFGLEVERSHSADRGIGLDWRLTALGVVPLRRESIAVSGLGTVVEPARVGVLIQLAVGPRWLF